MREHLGKLYYLSPNLPHRIQKEACPGTIKSSLPLDEHRDLILDITSSLGISFPEIRPGNCLMPSLSAMPEHKTDFIWTWLPTTIFVSDQIKRTFEAQLFRGLSFSSHSITKRMGNGRSWKPSSVQFQDIQSASPLWEMTFPYISNFSDIGKEHFKCQECRRVDPEDIPKELVISLVNRFDMIKVRG